MPSAADLRAELKVMREEHPDHQPVSRMKKGDISNLIERMKFKTETTPAVAQTKKEPTKPAKGEVESLAVAKTDSLAPVKASKAPAKAKAPKEVEAAPKEDMKARMARIRAMRKK